MNRGGDDREQRAHIRGTEREGKSAGEAGLSTGADTQLGHPDAGADEGALHAEKGKS